MSSPNGLDKFIAEYKSRGKTIEDVKKALKQSGWSDEQINHGLEASSSTKIAAKTVLKKSRRSIRSMFRKVDDSTQPYREKADKRRLYIAVALVSAVLFMVIIFFSFIKSDSGGNSLGVSTVSQEKAYDDPNFKVELPENWLLDARYETGDLVLYYYNTQDPADRLTLSVFVGLNNVDRIDKRAEVFALQDFNFLSDETVDEGGLTRRIADYTYEEPNEDLGTIKVMSVTVVDGELVVNADVSGKIKNWANHKDEVTTILESIQPLCQSSKYTKTYLDSNSRVDLCE